MTKGKTFTGIPTKCCALAAAVALVMTTAMPVLAQGGTAVQASAGGQSESVWQLNIPVQPLPQAIAELSAATGLQVLYTEQSLFQHTVPALDGRFTLRQALRTLLAGSGFEARFTGEDSVTIQKAAQGDSAAYVLRPITVVGRVTEGVADPYADEQKRLNTLRPDLILGGDQMKRFPDEHIGKALDRLPGMFSTSPSEKQEVRVRGLDKQFTRVEMDGVTIPGAGRWRNLSVGAVASSLVDEVRVIRNPTADIEHDGIGGRVSVKYRRVPQDFAGNAELLGGVIREVDDTKEMFASRANVWAGGPVSETFGILGALDVSSLPMRREHMAEQSNADGSFRELLDRVDRADTTRVNTFLKMGWSLDQGYLEFEPLLFAETGSGTDVRKISKANGDLDHRNMAKDSHSVTGGANLRWEQQWAEHWQLDSRLSWFQSNQRSEADEVRLRYKDGALDRTNLSNTTDKLTDELVELRSALAYDWSSENFGKFEVGVQARRNQRDGRKSSIEDDTAQEPKSGDRYRLTEDYLAGWARQQFKFLDERLRVEPGVRVEDYNLSALSNDGLGGSNSKGSDDLHIGPSLHASWRMTPQLTVQGAISRTLNRPQLDQITPTREEKGGELIQGNPDIGPATSTNLDLGVVWSTPEAFLAATLFHKDIDDLIVSSRTGEQVGSLFVVQPVNAESGTLRGLELEQRFHLGATGIKPLHGLSVWSNQTLFDGKMRLASGRQVPFFGEPDYLVAAGIDWVSPSSAVQVSLAVNHNGKRTEEDEFSRKRFDGLTTVDLSAAYAITSDLRIRLEASNLFNEQESGPRANLNNNHELTHVEYRTVSIPQTLWLGFDMSF